MPGGGRKLERVDLGRLKAAVSLRELVERRGVRLKRNGTRPDWWGCCPFHGERSPSFHVVEDKGFYHCFGCGAHGSAIDLVMQLDGLDFGAAVRLLAGDGPLPDAAAVRRREQRLAEEERQALEAKQETAASYWRSARPIEPGDLAERYLEGRGLRPPWPASLRQGRWVSKAGRGWPALIAAVTRWPDRRVVGVQLTPLVEPGRKALEKPSRLTQGELRCGAVRLAPWREGAPIVITEGVEDGLAVRLAEPDAVVWAILGTANGPRVLLPDGCPVVLALDGDRPGRIALSMSAAPLVERGHAVRLARLSDGLDPLDAQVNQEKVAQAA